MNRDRLDEPSTNGENFRTRVGSIGAALTGACTGLKNGLVAARVADQ